MAEEKKPILNNESSNENKITVSVDKVYYDKYKHTLATHTKKHITAWVVAAVALVTCGGLAAGHFAYKATHPKQDTIEERIIVNPELQDKAEITTPVIDDQGNAHTSVSVKDKTLNCIGDVEVYIGSWKCNNEEYELIEGNGEGKPQSYEIVIKKEALEKHEGKISVSPIIEIIKKTINFKAYDFIAKEWKEATEEIEHTKHPYWPSITLSEGLEISGWKLEGGSTEIDLNQYTIDKDTPNGLTFEAYVSDTTYFDVKFDQNYTGCPDPEIVKVHRGSTLSKPADPVRTGYTFDYWYENDSATPFDFGTTRFTEDGTTLHAKWTINEYTVTFDLNGGTDSSTTSPKVTDPQTVKYKNKAIEPDKQYVTKEGYTLVGWLNNGQIFDFNTEITENVSLVASWQVNEITITLAHGTGGSAQRLSPTDKIYYGDEVVVLATPDTGYSFAGWFVGEDPDPISTMTKYSFKAETDLNLTAKFTQDKYKLTVVSNPEAGGSATTDKDEYTYGTNATLTATPNPGYSFVGWYDESGTELSTANPYADYEVKGNATITAKFSQDEYVITVETGLLESGTVTGGGTYTYEQKITLTATPNPGYSFYAWYEDGVKIESSTASYEYTVTKTATLTAEFTHDEYALTVSANPSDKATAVIVDHDPGDTYYYGQEVTVKATANTPGEYSFDGWYENGTRVSTSATYKFNIKGNTTLVAQFTQNKYTIIATASPKEGGVVTGSATEQAYGSVISLNATPNAGYKFDNWKDADTSEILGSNTTLDHTVTQSRHIVANFIKISDYVVKVDVNDTSLGTVTPYGEQTGKSYGDVIYLEANPRAGCTFEGWYNGATKITGDAEYNYTVTGSATVTAHFVEDEYTVKCDLAGGSSTAQQLVWYHLKYNDTIAESMDPKPTKTGCEFEGWYYRDNDGNISEFKFGPDGTGTGVQGNWTIIARWKAQTTHIVSFDSNGGSLFVPAQSVVDNETITSSPSAGTKTGYEFVGWFNGDTQFVFGTTKVTSDLTLKAKWKDKVATVEFSCNKTITGAGGDIVDITPVVTLKDSNGNAVTDAVGTISYYLADSNSTGTTIDETTGKITLGTSGNVKVKAIYTPKDGSAATNSNEVEITITVS